MNIESNQITRDEFFMSEDRYSELDRLREVDAAGFRAFR